MFKQMYLLDRYVELKNICIRQDPALPPDGFEFFVEDNGDLYGRYHNVRAKKYLEEAVEKVAKRKGGDYREVYVKDYPSFPLRGVIEGFYGTPFTDEQRKDLLVFLEQLRMNIYIYAPKDDPYHREKWRVEYPQAARENLRQLAAFAKERNVEFCFAISPGKDFDFANEEDYKILLKKLTDVAAFGVERFALLMDDIDPALSDKAKEKFSSPAQAHAYLANYLKNELPITAPLLFCPTEYMQNYDTPYRQALRETLEEGIEVFWTGYNTAAEVVTEEDGEIVEASFGRKAVLWDNYPVNDFMPKRRVYLGALEGRGRYLHRSHTGYIANLSGLYESNKLPLYTIAEYAWDCERYDPKKALDNAIRAYFKGCAREGKKFVQLNESSVMAEKNVVKAWLDAGNFKALDKHYKEVREVLDVLEEKAPKAFKEELSDLFEFAYAECAVYFAVRQGAKKEDLEGWKTTMNESRYATADLSLLQYVNEKYGFEEPFTVDAKRQIYRRWNKNDR